jgi:hypothetical protein
MVRSVFAKQDGPAFTQARARDTAALILQESGSLTHHQRMTVAPERPSGRLARYRRGPWVIWHHMRLLHCEPVRELYCYARGESQVATFACIRLFRKGAMLPSLHSPNTYPRPYIVTLY